ncbi:MAG: hypothetical protein RL141_926 [Candidatus Parcubacteria bacterium]|jgi:succinyl-CoA synthetase alpha subunit
MITWPHFDTTTPVLVQGITGKEGLRMSSWMRAAGTRVVAGITPGKGGQEVEGSPVFNTVREAREAFPNAVTSCIVVPGAHVRAAVEEAFAAGITFVYVLTEHVPVHDVRAMRATAAAHGGVLLGPSSVGYLQFPAFRLGYMGGMNPFATLKEGGLAILSGSGGMANETLMACARNQIGVRLCLATGGDPVNGCSLTDAIHLVESRADVTGIAVFVEPGNALLRTLLSGIIQPRKPLVICLPGDALESLPRGLPYGHAGTVLGEEDPSLTEVRAALTEKGYRTTARHETFIQWCREIM